MIDKYKNILIILIYAITYIFIWTITPYWFSSILTYFIDFTVFILLIVNSVIIYRGSKDIFNHLFLIHTLSTVEILMCFHEDDCTAYMATRGGYFLKYYFNIRFITTDIYYMEITEFFIAVLLITILYLEYKLIKRSLIN